MIARSAYIHIPFCKFRCAYCNFPLVAGRDDLTDDFLSAIELEIARTIPSSSAELDTLYLGGGTPSHLSINGLESLFKILQTRFTLAPDAEFSCEVNPLDCTAEKLELLRSAGVNRVCVGGQSFQPRKLHRLQRNHSADQLRAALQRTRGTFSNVSLDLIYGVPGETVVEWRADLNAAIEFELQHISAYGLIIERGSAFYGQIQRGQFREVETDLQRILYETAIDQLTAAGMLHYDFSGFAKPGLECRHFVTYSRGESWWAFGPGAVSFIDSLRTVNHRSTATYMRRIFAGQTPVAEERTTDF